MILKPLNKRDAKKTKTNMHAQSVYRNLSFGTTKPRDLEYVFPVPQLAGLLTRSST